MRHWEVDEDEDTGGGIGLWIVFAAVLFVTCAVIVAQCIAGAPPR